MSHPLDSAPPVDPDRGDGRSVATSVPSGEPSSDLDRVLPLIELVESQVPETYRVEVLRALIPRTLGPTATEPMPTPPSETAASPLRLGRYSPILATSGKMLLKALVALEATSSQLGIEWMTPSEIERFLAERARVRSVYRTNVSNALRAARELVDRRRRGRGYEYRITVRGRAALERDLAIAGT